MRVLAIRGRNLASLAGDFEVDFEAAPLADAGIFAITGPTGAGKSTLLDAMCLALFDAVPRLGAASRTRIESEGDEISATDSRTILRHGTGEGFAEIDFVARDGERYRARWIVERARQKVGGRMQKSKQQLSRIDTAERIGGTKTETLAAIRDLVGLTVEQFRRAVLLAQGDFEAFIKANADDRAVLLERITDSRIYTTLGKAAYEKAASLRLVQQRLSERLASQDAMDDEARVAAEARRDEAGDGERRAGMLVGELERAAKWQADRATLAGRLAACEDEAVRTAAAVAEAQPDFEALRGSKLAYTLAQDWVLLDGARIAVEEARSDVSAQASQADVITAEVTMAEDATRETEAAANLETQRAELLRPPLEKARTSDRRISETVDALAAMAAPRGERDASAKACVAERDRALAAMEAAVSVRDGHASWLSANRNLASLVAREEEIAGMLADRDAVTQNVPNLSVDMTAAEERLREAEEVLQRTRALGEERTAAYAPALARLLETEAALPAEADRKALVARRDALAALRPLLIEWRGEASRAVDLETRIAGASSDAAGIRIERDRLLEQRASVVETLPGLRIRLDEARRAGVLAEAAADETALRLRALLVEGEPCPVCGATEHSTTAIGALLCEQLEAQRERIASLEKDLTAGLAEDVRLGTRTQALVGRLEAVEREIAQLGDQLAERVSSRDSARALLSGSAAKVGFDASDGDFEVLLASALTAIDERRRLMDAAVEAFTSARMEEASARRARDEAAETVAVVFEQWRGAGERATLAKAAVVDAREASDRLGRSLDAAFGEAAGWRDLENSTLWLTERVTAWRTRTSEHAEAVAALPELESRLASSRDGAATASALASAVEAEAARLAETLDVLRTGRAALLEGRAVVDVETELNARVATARARHEEAVAALAAARQRSSAAEARREGAASAMVRAGATSDRLEAAFRVRLAELDLTREAVAAAVAGGAEVIDNEQRRLDGIVAESRDADTAVIQRRADLALHEADGRPDLAGEVLASALSEARSALETARSVLTEAAFALRRDDEVRERTAELRAELERERGASRVWLALADLIGDKEGRTFRRFAQGLTLDRLLAHANERLLELKPRFALERGAGGDMLIQVVDHDMGGEVRGVHNLSGGERFLVSLALALGLAEMSTGGGLRIESLFIDEGFGALDTSSLGQAIAVLEHLHATGRRVGVISHVEEVKERIPVKIEVSPVARGRSELIVTTS